ncbi:MAG: hypothetical protein B7Z02_03265 [Rhodobacterales bacterium 32-67-9]|nr:MAG: hypothetical protein B7Z02_03265 [Rhodobacterales bacterium 32-67-9]
MQEAFEALRGHPLEPGDDPVTVELVFAEERTPDAVADQIRAALPGVEVEVDSAFGSPEDRFHFVTFPGIAARGQEPEVFAFARALRRETGATDANPVLADSLYGAAAIGGGFDTEAALFSCETPRENLSPFGWVHPVIRTPQAWTRSRGQGAIVAVIDTGHSSHQELNGIIRSNGQLNLVEGGTDASDRFNAGFLRHPGHGTLVCSVVASRGSANGAGDVSGPGAITGSAPEATVLPIRAIRSVINFSQRTIPAAIAHAVAQGADVITMAMGGPTRVSATEKALRDATRAGLVVTCAAGNCWPKVVFPAAYAANGLCTAVAALTHTQTPWPKTGRGPEVTIAAPGEHVWGAAKNKATDPDNGIKAAQGTTLATSLTAGVAALWVARHGGRAALAQKASAAGTTVQAMFVHCLTHGLTKPPVWNGATDLGAGMLDAERLLGAALPAGPTGTEAVAEAALPAAGVEPTSEILALHLANHNPEALDEYGPEIAEYAAEILWLSHRAGARTRAAETEGVEAAMIRPDRASAGLRAALATRPELRAVVAVP